MQAKEPSNKHAPPARHNTPLPLLRCRLWRVFSFACCILALSDPRFTSMRKKF
jgi:hypothetical protein